MLCPCGSADGTRLAVLVVEDEPMVALHLQSILEDNGYNVLGPVGTVGEALRLLAREQPDLAVLDVNPARTPDYRGGAAPAQPAEPPHPRIGL